MRGVYTVDSQFVCGHLREYKRVQYLLPRNVHKRYSTGDVGAISLSWYVQEVAASAQTRQQQMQRVGECGNIGKVAISVDASGEGRSVVDPKHDIPF